MLKYVCCYFSVDAGDYAWFGLYMYKPSMILMWRSGDAWVYVHSDEDLKGSDACAYITSAGQWGGHTTVCDHPAHKIKCMCESDEYISTTVVVPTTKETTTTATTTITTCV